MNGRFKLHPKMIIRSLGQLNCRCLAKQPLVGLIGHMRTRITFGHLSNSSTRVIFKLHGTGGHNRAPP